MQGISGFGTCLTSPLIFFARGFSLVRINRVLTDRDVTGFKNGGERVKFGGGRASPRRRTSPLAQSDKFFSFRFFSNLPTTVRASYSWSFNLRESLIPIEFVARI